MSSSPVIEHFSPLPSDESAAQRSPLSVTGAHWQHLGVDDEVVESLIRSMWMHPTVTRCMALRGIDSSDKAKQFLRATLDDLHDPYLMEGMERAVARLRQAVAEDEHIRVVTDYDVDGNTSSLILQNTLRLLQHERFTYHIPHRIEEGYGFSVQAAEQAARDDVQLIVTADIGVKDHAAVSRAKALGVDVVILDHHLPPGDDVPSDAHVVLCPPQRRCTYPNQALAACGVSLKLAQALLQDHPYYERFIRSLLKAAAIGTVADVVDLLSSENRAIVALGLQAINADTHGPGLSALLEAAGLEQGFIHAMDLGFRLGPRINAAGRLASSHLVIDLFNERSPARAREMAQRLDGLNQERREIQEQMLKEAKAQVPDPLPLFIVVHGHERDGWHRGIAGIVAARLRDHYNRPAAVIACTDEEAVGSVRSIGSVHAVTALETASALLTRFGGHPAAAGFSLHPSNVDALAQVLDDATRQLLSDSPPPLIREVDAVVHVDEINRRLFDELTLLGPHGKGNPEPRLCIRGARLEGLRTLKDRHLKAWVEGAKGLRMPVLWWNAGAHYDELKSYRGEIELLGVLELNRWRGRESLQLRLKDVRLVEAA